MYTAPVIWRWPFNAFFAPTAKIEPVFDIAVETPNSDPPAMPFITREFVASRTGSNGVGGLVGADDAFGERDEEDDVSLVSTPKLSDADSVSSKVLLYEIEDEEAVGEEVDEELPKNVGDEVRNEDGDCVGEVKFVSGPTVLDDEGLDE